MQHGQITLDLPAEDAFSIDAHAKVGDVYSEFDGNDPRRKLGHDFIGTAGAAAGAAAGPAHQLALQVKVGDIVILKAVK